MEIKIIGVPLKIVKEQKIFLPQVVLQMLSVTMNPSGELVLYAMVAQSSFANGNETKHSHVIEIFSTDELIHPLATSLKLRQFIATVSDMDGKAYHVFENLMPHS